MSDIIQDWTPVIIRKKIKSNDSSNTSKLIQKTQKPPSTLQITDEGEKLKTVSNEMAQTIIKARVAKGWKQKDLAKNTCIDEGTIKLIEQGNYIYNALQINKIAQKLGVNIPRK